MKIPQSCNLLIPCLLSSLIELLRRHQHAPFERENPFTPLVVGNRLNGNHTSIKFSARELFIQHPRFSVNCVSMKGGSEMFDVLKFEIGNSFATHIRHAHTKRNTEDERTHYKALFVLCRLTIEGIDMQGLVVHGKHAERPV